MTELRNLTVAQLRQVVSIKEQIESLTAQLNGIMGAPSASVPEAPVERRGKYKRSAAARAAMAAAQKARWTKVKGEVAPTAPVRKRRKMSAAARARMAAAAKARWAKAKADGKTRL